MTVLPPETPVIEAAKMAVEQAAHLIIDEEGRIILSPRVLPGQQRICVFQRERKTA